MQSFDVVIVGAGAAGLFCAGVAGQLGLKVLVLDHSEKVAEKIRISGGGRANFTNMDVTAANFLSDNPRFAKSALSRFTPADFVALVKKHGIAFHEKHKGQLFCDRSAEDLIAMLLAECAAGGVERWQPCGVKNVRFLASSPYGESASSYEIDSDRGTIHCGAVVIASGGLSIPKIGATDFGYRVAKQFDLPLVTPRPALVPLTFDEAAWAPFAQLSGLSLLLMEMLLQTPIERFLEAMAAGLNGPDAEGKDLKVNLVLTDLKESYVLWIENSVLHFKKASPADDANATLTLTRDIFVKMIAGTAGVKDTLLSDDLKIGGSKIDLVRFFGLIDKAPGTFAIVTK